MAAPLVSVLVPTHNHAAFIGETLDSVLAQDYPSFEVIVGDDASTDGTADVAAQYERRHPDRVRLMRAERNLGIAANFTRLMEAMSGTYYAWLGGDDLMLPGKLAKQVALMEANPDAAGSVHDAEVFVSDTGEVLGRFSEVYNGTPGFLEGGAELWLRPGYYTLPSTMMIRSSKRPPHGYDGRMRYSMEWVYDIETFRNGRCVVLDEVLGRYRRHSGNVTTSADHARVALEENLMALAIVTARFPDLAARVRTRRTGLFVSAALTAMARGERRGALRWAAAALRDGGPVNVARVAAALGRVRLGRRRLGVPDPV